MLLDPAAMRRPSVCYDTSKSVCTPLTIAQTLQKATAFEFEPQTKPWSESDFIHPADSNFVFEVRNIVVHDVDPPSPIDTAPSACSDSLPSRILDLFDGDNRDELGGRWAAYSDTSSVRPLDSTRGWSTVKLAEFAAFDTALFEATLGKAVLPSQYQKYAGWAGVATRYPPDRRPDLNGLRGISFGVQAVKWSLNLTFDVKILQDSIPDAQSYRARIAPQFLQLLERHKVCVRPEDFKQPDWAEIRRPLDLAKIRGFAWETRISSEADTGLSWETAAFNLDSVILWGIGERPVRMKPVRERRGPTFTATYERGELGLRGVEGFRQLEIVSAAGTRVASLPIDAGHAPRVDLGPGVYLLVARDGTGKPVRRALAVLR